MPSRRKQRERLPVELDRRDVRRRASSREDVDDEQVDGAGESGGQAVDHLPGIPVSHPDRRLRRPRQLCAHEVDQILFELDHLLPRAGPGRLDVARQREGARAEVHDRHRFAGRAEHVDHVAHPLHVLEEQVARIVEVHVRLRRAVDDEGVRAIHPAIGRDDRLESAQLERDGRVIGHVSRVLGGGVGTGSRTILPNRVWRGFTASAKVIGIPNFQESFMKPSRVLTGALIVGAVAVASMFAAAPASAATLPAGAKITVIDQSTTSSTT